MSTATESRQICDAYRDAMNTARAARIAYNRARRDDTKAARLAELEIANAAAELAEIAYRAPIANDAAAPAESNVYPDVSPDAAHTARWIAVESAAADCAQSATDAMYARTALARPYASSIGLSGARIRNESARRAYHAATARYAQLVADATAADDAAYDDLRAEINVYDFRRIQCLGHSSNPDVSDWHIANDARTASYNRIASYGAMGARYCESMARICLWHELDTSARGMDANAAMYAYARAKWSRAAATAASGI